MKNKEIGLKGIYRFFGELTAGFLYKYFKVFNPNIITFLGFIICISSIIVFWIYGEKLSYDIYMIFFLLGTQVALVLDFADGSYARMIDKTSYYGHVLDASFDFLKLFFLFGLSYWMAENYIERTLIFGLVLIYAFYCALKPVLTEQFLQNQYEPKNQTTSNVKRKMNYAVRILFGFNIAHFYFYISIWFLSGWAYVLFILYIAGLFSILKMIKSSFTSIRIKL